MLTQARKARTEAEVEQEFRERGKTSSPGRTERKADKQKDLNFFENRIKAKCLLLPSQIEILKEVFDRCDKYKDFILKRTDFVLALRTDELVVDFVDADAVECADFEKTVLKLD
jgi:hypothetical protein